MGLDGLAAQLKTMDARVGFCAGWGPGGGAGCAGARVFDGRAFGCVGGASVRVMAVRMGRGLSEPVRAWP